MSKQLLAKIPSIAPDGTLQLPKPYSEETAKIESLLPKDGTPGDIATPLKTLQKLLGSDVYDDSIIVPGFQRDDKALVDAVRQTRAAALGIDPDKDLRAYFAAFCSFAVLYGDGYKAWLLALDDGTPNAVCMHPDKFTPTNLSEEQRKAISECYKIASTLAKKDKNKEDRSNGLNDLPEFDSKLVAGELHQVAKSLKDFAGI